MFIFEIWRGSVRTVKQRYPVNTASIISPSAFVVSFAWMDIWLIVCLAVCRGFMIQGLCWHRFEMEERQITSTFLLLRRRIVQWIQRLREAIRKETFAWKKIPASRRWIEPISNAAREIAGLKRLPLMLENKIATEINARPYPTIINISPAFP